VFDDGEMIYSKTGIMSSSVDKSIMCGTYAIDAGFGAMSMPMIMLMNETDVDNVELPNVNLYLSNSTLYIEGEFTLVEIYSTLGALVGSYSSDEINLAGINRGVYIVRIINGNQSTTKKISL
jgi:hypothetical protein